MSRIFVIGGYGGCGGRLSRRLAEAGHHVLVAGRRGQRASAFCAGLPGSEPAIVDRDRDIAAALVRYEPDLVIDAAGPFQGSRYEVPFACIAAGIPYLDLADARRFVSGFSALNLIAGRVRVPIISGASTAPALTGAVVRHLAAGMDEVSNIDIALSAANRASGGDAVLAAVLAQVGQPIRLWRGGRWSRGFGWQEPRREDFRFADGTGLSGRLVALADLPDCELLPPTLPGRPAVTFRAGTEAGFQMRALWLASWPVRWGWIRSLAGWERWLLPLYRLTSFWGGQRSAMSVTVKGRIGTHRLERRWTIVAERGEGLEIPTLAAELLADDILTGRMPAGARDAASLLSLDRFEPALARLPVRHETRERWAPRPLYLRVLGPAFYALPRPLRNLHDLAGQAGVEGQAVVERGTNILARLLGAVMRFPPPGAWPLHVIFTEEDGRETWTRDFGGHRFSSELSQSGDLLIERFGPIRFGFRLSADTSGLAMHLVRWSVFGLRLPLVLAPRIAAREWADGDRFRFEVEAALPLLGRIVRYTGWLLPARRGVHESAIPPARLAA
jgi:NAD(P)-dependent dehydrogenase (short-subunit alcohol dehydrogenase family)